MTAEFDYTVEYDKKHRGRVADANLTTENFKLRSRIKELEGWEQDYHTAMDAAIRYEKALREMLTPPLILAEDDATQVADWFVSRARQAFTPEEEEGSDDRAADPQRPR